MNLGPFGFPQNGYPPGLFQHVAGGRLTLTSATPVTTSDVTAATRIYYTPHEHNLISLFTDGGWRPVPFNEVFVDLGTLTSGANYDVFGYDSGGLALEFSRAWTSDTARADAIERLDGVWVKSVDRTRRYLGTFRTTATTTTEDSKSKRFLWNANNRARKNMSVIEATASWNYTLATYQQARNQTSNQVEIVRGLNEDMVSAQVTAFAYNGGGAAAFVSPGIGISSSTVNSAKVFGGYTDNGVLPRYATAVYQDFPGLGYYSIRWLEAAQASGTVTWYGAPTSLLQAGLTAESIF